MLHLWDCRRDTISQNSCCSFLSSSSIFQTSLVCLAAQHTGGITNNKAIWTIEHSTNTFEPQLSNAIQSQ